MLPANEKLERLSYRVRLATRAHNCPALAAHSDHASRPLQGHRCINMLRGILREFGVPIALGVAAAKRQISAALADSESEVPAGVRPALAQMLEEITALEQKIDNIERELTALTRSDERVQQMRAIPGIGLLTSTAIRATVGDIQRFPSGRHFASWLGLTAREHSSAEHRRLGGISKRGDIYVRTLLVHGARSALLAAHRAQRSGRARVG